MELTTVVKNVLGVVGFPFTFMNLAIQRQTKVAPPGRIIETSSSALHVVETGKGPVTGILEAGLGSFSIDWYAVQPELKHAKVVAYDRGGYGWSTTHRKTMTIEDTVSDLKELVESLQLEPPFVLVGHSYGGLSMRLFAARYPELVSGLVLIDSVHENQYRKENYNHSYKRLVTFGYITSLIGIPRWINQRVGRKFLHKDFEKHLTYTGFHLKSYQTLYREYRDSIHAVPLLENIKLHQELPIMVVSSNNPSSQWERQQAVLAGLTTNTEWIQTEHGHSIHLENSELVIDIIQRLIEMTVGQKKESALSKVSFSDIRVKPL